MQKVELTMTSELLRVLRPVLLDEAKAEQILKRYWKSRIAIIWTVQHVHTAANERDRALTDTEATELLQLMLTNHDRQEGLKWSDLTSYIEEYKLGRNMNIREIRRFVKLNKLTIRR